MVTSAESPLHLLLSSLRRSVRKIRSPPLRTTSTTLVRYQRLAHPVLFGLFGYGLATLDTSTAMRTALMAAGTGRMRNGRPEAGDCEEYV